jgi:hypothetical protein
MNSMIKHPIAKNMENNIELELRAEVSLDQLEELLTNLSKRKKLLSHTKRLSVMFFGAIDKENFDIIVRISSNRETELVIKRGDYHAHNRVEYSQKIKKDQFIGIVKIFSLFGLQSKVTERENFVFDLGSNTTMVLVKAGSIAYFEIEKMSHEKNIEENKAELLHIINSFGLKLIDNDDEFNELCDRLTRYYDWVFDGTASHVAKLEAMLKPY